MSVKLGLIANILSREIICQYPTKIEGDHLAIINEKILPSLPATVNHLRTLSHGDHLYFIKVYNSILYLCIAESTCRSRTCWAFIDSLVELYVENYSTPSTSTSTTTCSSSSGATGSSIVIDQTPQRIKKRDIKQKIKFFNDHKNEKILVIYDQIDELKKIQIRNIDTMMERGDMLIDLMSSSDNICDTANCFYQQSKKALPWYLRLKRWVEEKIGRSEVQRAVKKKQKMKNQERLTQTLSS